MKTHVTIPHHWLLRLGIVCLLVGLSNQPSMGQTTLNADGVRVTNGALTFTARGHVTAHTAWFEPIENDRLDREQGQPHAVRSAVDATSLLQIEYESRNGLVFGFRGQVDTGDHAVEDFERDEVYAYATHQWGRVEVGLNDGPADTLSLHAPTVGLGQVRGNFGRYTGFIALLSPYDSRDAAKVSYFSAPSRGLRFGVSFAPHFQIGSENPVVQNDVTEIGAQYLRPIGGAVWGLSAAYVSGSADTPRRADVESWSVGSEIRRGGWTFGGAYVDRGRSNLRPTSNRQAEWNAGLRWRGKKWAIALSAAETLRLGRDQLRVGLGVHHSVTKDIFVRTDLVGLNAERTITVNGAPVDASQPGWVSITEIGFAF